MENAAQEKDKNLINMKKLGNPDTTNESAVESNCRHHRHGICWNENTKKYLHRCEKEDYGECEDIEVE